LKHLEKLTNIILSLLLILLQCVYKQVNGTGRWKVPADDMKHIGKLVTIMENCQQH